MIEVPDWTKQTPEVGDAGYEAGFDDNPFAKGKEIVVKRNGQNGAPDYTEGGWTIVDDDANVKIGEGKYIVGVVVEKEIEGQILQKSVPLNELMELNPRAEKEPLSEAQEDIAGEAIEDALGVVDPADMETIDREDIPDQSAREAAQRIINQEPVIPGLQEMMSGEKAPSELDKQLAAAEVEFDKLKDSLPSDKDRAAAWQYANAINYAERDSATKKLSYGFDQAILDKYTLAAQKMRDLRAKAQQEK